MAAVVVGVPPGATCARPEGPGVCTGSQDARPSTPPNSHRAPGWQPGTVPGRPSRCLGLLHAPSQRLNFAPANAGTPYKKTTGGGLQHTSVKQLARRWSASPAPAIAADAFADAQKGKTSSAMRS